MAATNFASTAQPVLQTLQQGLDEAVHTWRVEGLLSWPTVYVITTAVLTYWTYLVGQRRMQPALPNVTALNGSNFFFNLVFFHPLAGIPGPKFAGKSKSCPVGMRSLKLTLNSIDLLV